MLLNYCCNSNDSIFGTLLQSAGNNVKISLFLHRLTSHQAQGFGPSFFHSSKDGKSRSFSIGQPLGSQSIQYDAFNALQCLHACSNHYKVLVAANGLSICVSLVCLLTVFPWTRLEDLIRRRVRWGCTCTSMAFITPRDKTVQSGETTIASGVLSFVFTSVTLASPWDGWYADNGSGRTWN